MTETKRRSARITSFLNIVLRHPLVWLVFFVLTTVTILSRVTVKSTEDVFDPALLTITSLGYLAGAISITARTKIRMWSILGSGLLATFLADAIYWFSILQIKLEHHWFITHAGQLVTWVRALFFVGSIFVVFGLGQEWWDDRGNGIFAAKRWRRNRPGVNRNENEGASS